MRDNLIEFNNTMNSLLANMLITGSARAVIVIFSFYIHNSFNESVTFAKSVSALTKSFIPYDRKQQAKEMSAR